MTQNPPTKRLLHTCELVAHKLRKHRTRLVEHLKPGMRNEI